MSDGRTTPAEDTTTPAGAPAAEPAPTRAGSEEFRGRLVKPASAGRRDDEQPQTLKEGLKEAFSGEEFRAEVVRQLGGWRGIAESAVPVVVFVAINTLFSLIPALWAAVGVSIALAIFRLLRKQSPRQALNGLFGIAIAAFVAWRTGRAEDFYLPGILMSYLYAMVIAGSVFIKRPLVGVTWAFFGEATAGWREDRRLYRTFWWLTVLWAIVWILKVSIQAAMYLAGADATALGIARITLGNPPVILLLLITVWQVRRVTKNRPIPDGAPSPA